MTRRFVRQTLRLTIAAAISLVLLLPLVHCYSCLGGAGYIWKISGSPAGGERYIAVGNQGGVISVAFDNSPGKPFTVGARVSRRGPIFWWTMQNDGAWASFRLTLWTIGGGSRRIGAGSAAETEYTIHFPAWILIALCGVTPLMWIRRFREHRRRGFAPNLCPRCGYDRRATAEPTGPLLPRCPECGHVTDAPLHAALASGTSAGAS